MRSLTVLAIVHAAGCYNPSVAPCELACATGGEPCPSGLACNGQNLCAESANATCSDAALADVDPDSVMFECMGWPSISNVDPCALMADGVDTNLVVDSDRTIDTTGTNTPDFVVATPTQPAGGEVFVAMVHDLTVSARITVVGPRPLVILASGDVIVEVSGVIDFPIAGDDPTSSSCVTSGGVGPDGAEFAAGGGGGGFGVITGTSLLGGASGGGSSTDPANVGGPGGAPNIDPTLAPLRMGCSGGNGGSVGGSGFGIGGRPGGAIQIAAKGNLTVNGMISAGGEGGAAGGEAGAGGGGGGSGGAILLEAVELRGSPTLCANGGGGGAGGSGGGTPMPGSPANCSPSPAPGGGPPGAVGAGGAGAAIGAEAVDGELGTSGFGSGGGGGGVGRIRLNGMRLLGLPIISPDASFGP